VPESSKKRQVLNRKRRHVIKGMSPHKACEIMRHGEIGGEPMTPKQKGAFGALCGKRGK
jgi:hypothetical protein